MTAHVIFDVIICKLVGKRANKMLSIFYSQYIDRLIICLNFIDALHAIFDDDGNDDDG